MNTGKTVFAQLMSFLPTYEFNKCVEKYNEFKLDVKNMVYALGSSTIDLCLSLFPWAKFRKNKGAVKMYTLLVLRGSILTFVHLTDGLCHDVNVMEYIVVEPGAI